MISLSNGILKNKDSGSLHLSEVSLEAFTVSENKKETEKNIQMKKTTSKDPSDAGQETDADEHMEQEEKQESEQKETEGSISAEFILDQARRKTEALLLEAEKEAERIKKQAEKDGYTEGWERGWQEGKAKAAEESELQNALQQQEFHESLSRALESVEKEKKACLERYLEELKNLAVAVGEKVIRLSLKSNGDVIRHMIETETEKMEKKAWVRIYMEKDDYETMVQADGDVVSHLAKLSDNVKFIVMEQTAGGNCIIEMPDEIVDMSVDTQMENIRKLMGTVRF